jgi:hypothetical protein
MIESIVDKTDAWTLSHAGLKIGLGYIGTYGQGAPDCVVPWRDLKPYLAAKPAITIPPS